MLCAIPLSRYTVIFSKPNMKRHWKRKYARGFQGHEPDSTLVEAVLKKTLVPGSVVEIGAGAGHFTRLMEEWGYAVKATDLVVGEQLDITRERLGEYDNVVAMGVLHHILDHEKHQAALRNIKAMAQKKILLAVKLPAERLPKKTGHAYRYSVLDYTDILGSPVTVTDCGYLAFLEWHVESGQ